MLGERETDKKKTAVVDRGEDLEIAAMNRISLNVLLCPYGSLGCDNTDKRS